MEDFISDDEDDTPFTTRWAIALWAVGTIAMVGLVVLAFYGAGILIGRSLG